MLNKGFTLSEALLVIIILSTFYFLQTSLSQDDSIHKNLLAKNISNDLLQLQADSLLYREKSCFKRNDLIAQYPICFTNKGNINLSQTIQIVNSNLKITIFLGAGSHEIK